MATPISNVLMVSVRHTGTHFLREILSQHLTQHNSLYEEGEGFWFAHTEQYNMGKIREFDLPIVAPMRHPADCIRGWAKRGQALDKNFREQWDNLRSLHEDRGILFVPIDTEDRSLKDLSDTLGYEFTTDWTPRGKYMDSRTYLGPRPEDAYEWIRDNHSDFLHWYEL